MGSKPTMMPPTPITVSATAGLHAPPFLTWKIDTESVHVAFGNVVAEATPATHTSAASARKRVNVLIMGDPLVAGGRSECEARSGGGGSAGEASSGRELGSARASANDDLELGEMTGS